ncbi:Topoisomerase 1-associated factor 1, partial [Gonapodya sp. JEL0774]
MPVEIDDEPSVSEQRQSADDFYLLNAATSLGGWESKVADDGRTKRVYLPGVECIGCLRDLKRYLRRDDKNKSKHVLRQLGSWRIVQKDLIPILTQYVDDPKLSSAVVELLVPMTWPIDLESDDVPGQHDILLSYKEAFCREGGPLRSVFKVLLTTMAVPHRTRTDRDHGVIRMCLTLFLNLLLIKDPSAAPGASAEEYLRSTLQEELICRMKEDKILDFLVTLTGSTDDREFEEWNMIAAEILYNARSRRIIDAIEKEKQRKRRDTPQQPTRHSRFGGAFSFRMNDGQMVNISPNLAFANVNAALDKGKKERTKRAEKGEDEHHQHRAIGSERTRSVLKEFAEALLQSSFNILMHSMKRDFDREAAKVRKDDRARYLWLSTFFLEVQRESYRKVLADFVPPPKPDSQGDSANFEEPDLEPPEDYSFDSVASIVDLRTLAFIVKQVRQYNEDKEWTLLHIAVDCFKEILKTLDDMAACQFDDFKEVSQSLQHNLYYEASTLELIEQLLRGFKPIRHKKSYLLSLVETTHVFLRMLERFSRKKGVLFVRKKVKRKAKRKTHTGPKFAGQDIAEIPDVTNRLTEEEVAPKTQDTLNGGSTDPQNPEGADGSSIMQKLSDDAVAVNDEEDEDSAEEESTHQYVEHQFHFEKLEVKFASQSVIDAYCYLLRDYKSLTSPQLHMITKMMHRIAVRLRFNGLFFHVSTLALFNRILQDRRQLPSDSGGKELVECLTYCVKKFFKAASTNPWLMWD